MFKNKFWFIDLGGRRFGYEQSRVEHEGSPYLDRYILYVGGPTLRLHKFWRGDDDRAPHDHPWTFWTFPFSDYWEKTFRTDGSWYWNKVHSFTLNKRPATYRHIVVGKCSNDWTYKTTREPFWTFVVSTNYQRSWGFWPKGEGFVPWREWPAASEQPSATQRPHE